MGRPSDADPNVGRRFEELARLHQSALERKAQALCGKHKSNARDLVQDTLERGWRSFSNFPEDGNFRGWMLRIMHNRFIDQCRRLRLERPAAEQFTKEVVEDDEPPPTADWERVSTEDFRAAVSSLGGDFRLIYQLHAFEGQSYDEIAGGLDIPKATVGTRLLRARKKLKALLSSILSEHEGQRENAK